MTDLAAPSRLCDAMDQAQGKPFRATLCWLGAKINQERIWIRKGLTVLFGILTQFSENL
jgi:hypothetical protein